MIKYSPQKRGIFFISFIVLIVGLSILSDHIWSDKTEPLSLSKELKIEREMTVSQFGKINGLPIQILKEIFSFESKSDLKKKVAEWGTSAQIEAMVRKKFALASEHAGKNWIKILIKFGLWFVFLALVFIFLKNRPVTASIRKGLLFTAVLIFGVFMGSDPSPMGTVKDAIHLYGTTGAVFPPRLIALVIFLIIVMIANKYICGWGCQIGTLQDFIFRINQTDRLKSIIGRQFKLPFALTNTIRFSFLCIFTLVAFLWSMDIIEPIDPFKLFKPLYLGIIGGIFVGALLLASLFVYRPWCHLFCPFGLVGWIFEKVSFIKVSVDYDTCIACLKCTKACPSTVMDAILKHDKKTIPDCFACYACRDVCPTNSISFSTRKRTLPQADHFKKKEEKNND
jgi:polyferredoxin